MTTNRPELSVIIVSYNTKQLTLECLRSLYEQTRKIDFETIVVDNASADGSAQAVTAEAPQVRLIALEKNIGFAAANNLAAKYTQGQYLLLLNPDTVIRNNAVEKLLTFARANRRAGIWGGRTIFGDGSLNPTCCYNKMTPWSLFCRAFGLSALFNRWEFFNPEDLGGWQYNSVRQVDIITGCFMLVKRPLWDDLAGFDPLFFMYGEEVDFCLRAADKGFRPLFTPEAEIVHYGGVSEPNDAVRSPKLFKAKTTLIRLHWPKLFAGFGVAMLRTWVAVRAAFFAVAGLVMRKRFRAQKEKWLKLWQSRKKWITRSTQK